MKIKFSRTLGGAVAEIPDQPEAISPFRLKKILVPMDFSPCSQKALRYAVAFAQQFSAGIIVLHVIPDSLRHVAAERGFDLVDYEPALKAGFREETERRLAALVGELVPAEISARVEVRCGVHSIEIVKAAKEMGADIIILSTHGRTGRAHAFAGSVAGDVARLAPCPVLVVREREHEFIQEQAAPQPLSAVA